MKDEDGNENRGWRRRSTAFATLVGVSSYKEMHISAGG